MATGGGKKTPSERTKAELDVKLQKTIAKYILKIKKVNEAIAAEELEVSRYQAACDKMNAELIAVKETLLLKAQAKAEKAKNQAKDKLMNQKVITELNQKTTLVKRDSAEMEKDLDRLKKWEDMLFQLSPRDWQEAQKAKTLTATKSNPEDTTASKENISAEDEIKQNLLEASFEQEDGLKTSPHGQMTDGIQSSSNQDTLGACGSSVDKEHPEIYFTDPSQVADLLSEMRHQIWFMLSNATIMDKTPDRELELMAAEMKKEEDDLTRQLKDMKISVEKEEERAAMFRKNVEQHELLKTETDDSLERLEKQVAEVHSSVMKTTQPDLSTMNRLQEIEAHVFQLMDEVEMIPRDFFRKMWKKKKDEIKKIQEEENIKQKCIDRARERKAYTGKKLMPRTFLKKTTKMANPKPEIPEEEDPLADLYTEN